MTRRLGAAVVPLVALVLAGSSAGQAPPRPAVAAALRALGAGSGKGAVVVYRSPGVLPAGTLVADAGPARVGGAAAAPVPTWKVARPSWLFWADLDPGADFSHPSRLALVDAATARVAAVVPLAWYPLVNGRPLVTRLFDPRLVVFSRQAQSGFRRTAGRASLPAAAGSAAFDGEHDCLVLAVDAADPRKPTNFFEDGSAMSIWASTHGLSSHFVSSAAQLDERIGEDVVKGCNDVVILLAGHGLAKPGTTLNGQPVASSAEPTVVIGQTLVRDANGRPVTQGGKQVVRLTTVTASDIRSIVLKYRKKARFKLIVDSCFGGRFEGSLGDLQDGTDPPIRVLLTAAGADEPSIRLIAGSPPSTDATFAGYFIHSLVQALGDVAKDPSLRQTANGDLATTLEIAEEKAIEDAAKYGNKPVELGKNHPGHWLATAAEPQTLHLEPLTASFDSAAKATDYKAPATTILPGGVTYLWTLSLGVLPEDAGKGSPDAPNSVAGFDPACNNQLLSGGREQVATSTSAVYYWKNQLGTFTWYHGDKGYYAGAPYNSTYGCNHELMGPHGHEGIVSVKVTDGKWTCRASFEGTGSFTAVEQGPPATCAPGR